MGDTSQTQRPGARVLTWELKAEVEKRLASSHQERVKSLNNVLRSGLQESLKQDELLGLLAKDPATAEFAGARMQEVVGNIISADFRFQLQELGSRLSQTEHDLQQARSELIGTKAELALAREKQHEAQQRAKDTEIKLKSARGEMAALIAERKAVLSNKDAARLTAERSLSSIEARAVSAESSAASLSREIDAIKAQLQHKHQEALNLTALNAQLEAEFQRQQAQWHEQASQLQEVSTTLKLQNEELQHNIAMLQEKNQKSPKEVQEVQQKYAEERKQRKKLASELAEVESLLAESERERRSLKAKYLSIGDKLEGMRTADQEKAQLLARLEQEVTGRQRAEQRWERKLEAVEQEARELRSAMGNGVAGPSGQQLVRLRRRIEEMQSELDHQKDRAVAERRQLVAEHEDQLKQALRQQQLKYERRIQAMVLELENKVGGGSSPSRPWSSRADREALADVSSSQYNSAGVGNVSEARLKSLLRDCLPKAEHVQLLEAQLAAQRAELQTEWQRRMSAVEAEWRKKLDAQMADADAAMASRLQQVAKDTREALEQTNRDKQELEELALKLRQELESLRDTCSRMRKLLEEGGDTNTQLVSRLEAEQKTVQELRQQVEHLSVHYNEAMQQLQFMEAERRTQVNEQVQKAVAAEGKAQQAIWDMERAEARLAESEAGLHAKNTRALAQERATSVTSSFVARSKTSQQELQEVLQQLRQEVADKEAAVADLQQQLADAAREATTARAQAKELEGAMQQLRTELQEHKEQSLKEASTRAHDIERLTGEAAHSQQHLLQSNTALAAQLSEAQQQAAAAQQRASAAESSVSISQHQQEELRQQVEELRQHLAKEHEAGLQLRLDWRQRLQQGRKVLVGQTAALRVYKDEVQQEMMTCLEVAQKLHVEQLLELQTRCDERVEEVCHLAAADAGQQIAMVRTEADRAASLVEALKDQVAALQRQREALLLQLGQVVLAVSQGLQDSEDGHHVTVQLASVEQDVASGSLDNVMAALKAGQAALLGEVRALRQDKAVLLSRRGAQQQQLAQSMSALEDIVAAVAVEAAVPAEVQAALLSPEAAVFEQGLLGLQQAIQACLHGAREATAAALEAGAFRALHQDLQQAEQQLGDKSGQVVELQQQLQELRGTFQQVLQDCRQQCMDAAVAAFQSAQEPLQQQFATLRAQVEALQQVRDEDVGSLRAAAAGALETQRQHALLGLEKLEEAAGELQERLIAELDRGDTLSAETARLQQAAKERERVGAVEAKRAERQGAELERLRIRLSEAEAAETAAHEEARSLRRSLRTQGPIPALSLNPAAATASYVPSSAPSATSSPALSPAQTPSGALAASRRRLTATTGSPQLSPRLESARTELVKPPELSPTRERTATISTDGGSAAALAAARWSSGGTSAGSRALSPQPSMPRRTASPSPRPTMSPRQSTAG